MTNFGSLLQSPEQPRSVSTIEGSDAQLLELRTEAGTVYVCPSRWERLRLQWTFRHFHVLPPQVLSRGDQRLIEKLAHSAVVTPALPGASHTVLGVVELVRSKPPASTNRVVTLRPELAASQAFRAKSRTPGLPSPPLSIAVKQRETRKAPSGAVAWGVHELCFHQWRSLGALAAIC